jgi:hypothetical protein
MFRNPHEEYCHTWDDNNSCTAFTTGKMYLILDEQNEDKIGFQRIDHIAMKFFEHGIEWSFTAVKKPFVKMDDYLIFNYFSKLFMNFKYMNETGSVKIIGDLFYCDCNYTVAEQIKGLNAVYEIEYSNGYVLHFNTQRVAFDDFMVKYISLD